MEGSGRDGPEGGSHPQHTTRAAHTDAHTRADVRQHVRAAPAQAHKNLSDSVGANADAVEANGACLSRDVPSMSTVKRAVDRRQYRLVTVNVAKKPKPSDCMKSLVRHIKNVKNKILRIGRKGTRVGPVQEWAHL